MTQWIETKVRYEKTMENGLPKKVTETCLVEALSFTEAESRVIKEIGPFMPGGFTVSAVRRSNIAEIFRNADESAGKWFKVKACLIAIDEKTMREKRTASYTLVRASDLHAALRSLDEGVRGTMADYQIVSIAETPIVSVHPAKSPEP